MLSKKHRFNRSEIHGDLPFKKGTVVSVSASCRGGALYKFPNEKEVKHMKLITSYQAWWDPKQNTGWFWFTYYDGARMKTVKVDATSFKIVLDILRNEKPVYGDHNSAAVTTQAEQVGEEET